MRSPLSPGRGFMIYAAEGRRTMGTISIRGFGLACGIDFTPILRMNVAWWEIFFGGIEVFIIG